jgi:hypothetical protein
LSWSLLRFKVQAIGDSTPTTDLAADPAGAFARIPACNEEQGFLRC